MRFLYLCGLTSLGMISKSNLAMKHTLTHGSNNTVKLAAVAPLVVASALLLIGAKKPPTATVDTGLISLGLDGLAGIGDPYYVPSEIRAGAVSADGRYVTFSIAQNFTADDVSGWHVYLKDREIGTTTLRALAHLLVMMTLNSYPYSVGLNRSS